MIKSDFCDGWELLCKDGTKRKLRLPHDAMLEEPRSPKNKSGAAGAYFPGGIYTYEKTFTAPSAPCALMLEFEGIYKNSSVFLNGERVGGADYGYIPFFTDLCDTVRWGEKNTLRVVADNSAQPNSRWYTGSGIYRPVWLWQGDMRHISPRGVKITTLSCDPARVLVEVEHNAELCKIEIFDREGKRVAYAEGDRSEIDIPLARLWSAESPYLYRCVATVKNEDGCSDAAEEFFGIRRITWNKNGLFINGSSVKLRGGCIHHDNGILGACSYPESEERRIKILKKCGFNAIRSAHNPISTSMLEACDRLGMYVMDETWDTWKWHKNPYDYALDFEKNFESDIKLMVERDYNHPSVIMYSIGNEISDPASKDGVETEKTLIRCVHSLDSTRPVTAGLNLMLLWTAKMGMGVYKEDTGGMNDAVLKHMEQSEPKASGSLFFNIITSFIGITMEEFCRLPGVSAAIEPACRELDIVGYNYGSGRYIPDTKRHPERLIMGSETFRPAIAKNWKKVEKIPNLIGDFQWAAWDYLGEAGCGAWTYVNDGNNFNKPYPWLLADSASVNILGHPTAEADLAGAVWHVLERPAIHVRPLKYSGHRAFKSTWRGTDAIPSWSWQGCDGKRANIEVYFDAYEIELILNGKPVKRKKCKDCKAKFTIPYEKGTLEAIAYDKAGNEISKNILRSASEKLGIRLLPEEKILKFGELAYVAVDIVGDNGEIESNRDMTVSLSVSGGELLGFGSANPKTEESYLGGSFTTYYGRALAVIRAGDNDKLTVFAKSGDIISECEIKIGG